MTGSVPNSENEAMKLWEQYKDRVYECTKDARHLENIKQKSFEKINNELKSGLVWSITMIIILLVIFGIIIKYLYSNFKNQREFLFKLLQDAKNSRTATLYQVNKAENDYDSHTFPFGWSFFWFLILAALIVGFGYGVIGKNQIYIDKINDSFQENHIEYIWNNYPNVIVNHPYDYTEKYTKLQHVKIEL
jgi:hypothetical protein